MVSTPGTFAVLVDADHGARITSLRDPSGREWLWQRPNPDREQVRPGDRFVDVGGIEECFPTIGGEPDHGDVWTRPWTTNGDWLTTQTGPYELSRRLIAAERVTVDYHLTGPPGSRFIWAMHALLEPVVGTVLDAAAGPCTAWPGHDKPVATGWPPVLDQPDWNVLGDNDGTAMFCQLPGQTSITVR